MTQFALEPIYGSLTVAILLALLTVGVIAMVTPPTDDPKKRKWLIALRSFAGLVLLLAAMRPSLIRSDNRPAPATLVVAVDTSKSMTLPDGDGSDRWSSQITALHQLMAGVAKLDRTLDVRLLGYDSQTDLIGDAQDSESIANIDQPLQSRQPTGDTTDLGRAMQDSIDAAGGKPLAGVVMFGDGTQTATPDPTNSSPQDAIAARRGAEVLNALGVPLWTIPIGPPGSDGSARDVAVTNLTDSFRLFAGNQFDVAFAVETSGLANVQIPVTLSWIASDGSKTEARSRQIDPRGASETIGMNIQMTAPAPGLYRLQVDAAAQEGEWVTSNNSQTAFVEVRAGGGRILILEGAGRPEQTFVRRALRHFPDLELDYAPIRGDQNWPVSLDAVLQPGRYDVIMIGDLDASAIGPAQLAQIAERVGEGVGLITMGGFQTYGTGGYADGPLASVLPVQMDAALRRQPVRDALSAAEKSARQAAQLAGPIQVRAAKNHPIVALGGDGSENVWNSLPDLPGANRFVGPKVAAGVQVLLQTPQQQPLLVIGSYGKGRVASLAVDETFRWWRAGKAEAHRRFWRQLMLWLMSREESGGDSVVAEMDLRRFEPDATPEFRARLQTLSEDPSGVTLAASVIDANGQATTLEVTSTVGTDVRISGRIPKLEPGFYRLLVRASDDSIQSDEVAFQVTETSRELARPMADPVYMKQLADLTSAHGGAAFDTQQIEELIATIAEKRRSAQTPVIEKTRLGDGPASGWAVFLLFAGALTAEWLLRRRWGMA
ncbi:glutamine amidotransferase [Stieleria sp. TO1_6]|uniref:glutamine amidotransferase n=1 Tax=Stieleria tagensis TaxID=2956795 RepID=UPI00209BB859|nr:glutamine amidotransferase [Stieleria tagensis]MCO8124090.1 glutamine amidotransferase [Stieleria tagensis]